MLLHCLRHGASEANLAHRFNPTNDPLHETAHAELRRFAGFAQRHDHIFVSPLMRAVQTAEGLRLEGWTLEPRIAERDLGVFCGLTAAECRARHADAFAAFSRLEAQPPIPDGESRAAHLARVLEWVAETSGAHSGEVLAVTHGGVIDFLYRMGTGQPLHGGADIFGGDNLALSTFEVDWPEVRLVAFSVPLLAAA